MIHDELILRVDILIINIPTVHGLLAIVTRRSLPPRTSGARDYFELFHLSIQSFFETIKLSLSKKVHFWTILSYVPHYTACNVSSWLDPSCLCTSNINLYIHWLIFSNDSKCGGIHGLSPCLTFLFLAQSLV